MNFKKVAFLSALLVMFGFMACQKDSGQNGSVNFEITDAPIDDAHISGAFVTIADLQVDGQSVQGFNKTTIDLLAYQNGSTKLLSNADLDVDSYSNITLVLDYDKDANGNSPGCYVEDTDGGKHALVATNNEILVDHSFDVASGTTTNLVMDFDLRKAIVRNNNPADSYDFVTAGEMKNAVRVVTKDRTGTIKGNCSGSGNFSDKVVVYAYKKGTFDRNTEVQGQGQSNVTFIQAVSSATVDGSGNFELHFLEQGDYELHFASYDENNSTGQVELGGTILLDVISSLDIGAIGVGASTSITVNVLFTGVLPL